MTGTTNRLTIHPAKSVTFAIGLCALLISPAAQTAAFGQDQDSGQVTTINDVFAEVGASVPAFGGMFVDEKNDALKVYMVPGESGDVAALDQALTDAFGPARPPQHRIEVLPGQYTFLQLKGWLDRLTPQVLAIPGAEFTDIDDGRNRLEVGVETSTLAPAVEAILAQLSVPREAVLIETPAASNSLPDQDPAQPKTLRDEFRPLVGGLQITIAVKGLATAGICTLGFLATRDKVPGLVTNDHCIKEHQQMHLDLNIFYQPTLDDKYRVAEGSVDPDFFKTPQNKQCPEDRFCRFSDSAFAKLTDKVDDPVGYIAKPSSGSDWDGTTKYRIVGLAKQVKDMSVTRVGSQSGMDTGTVSSPCRNLNSRDSKGKDTGVTYLCQVVVGWTRKVEFGDSGSPVFTTNKDNNDVMLLGILWSDSGVSPIDQIKITGTELGPALRVCANGFDC